MIFIETSVFTKAITSLVSDDTYKRLQDELALRPEAGAVIKGSGGLRKIRWYLNRTGKRGGVRVIYYFDEPDRIYMLFAYRKNQQEDLTPSQLRIVKQIVTEWLL
ncbi:type II toxin-antitoxin system RelE/ParE family toxin [Chitinispirillales bacterium ANBcel5]|uniref:type II toxin-antitoxin system RelE/ParE family toxin n=1 Tax=Cellulosispirillum alkaliphilum TaxID=3039283 RepID=UPI002A536318|nr:type II toxin-antitoxin system RelE/ParE family toxin [Chitinispirillales bacterium ANBcel5]